MPYTKFLADGFKTVAMHKEQRTDTDILLLWYPSSLLLRFKPAWCFQNVDKLWI